ncbi:MAG TPA: hypothetical protein VKQ32_24335 [Polyangia bacterium]|nr:hypothetical protein [Polyangia bacterium]
MTDGGGREPLEPISDPRLDPWATWALMIALLAIGSVVAIIRARVHGMRELMVATALALIALVFGVVALVRGVRAADRRARVVPAIAVVASLAAVAGALVFFVVH